MRILLLHADYLEYETLKPALKIPPDPPGSYKGGPLVAVYVSVERNDSERTSEMAAKSIAEYALNIVKERNVVIYPYAHLSSDLARPSKAHKLTVLLEKILRNTYGLNIHRAPFGWYKRFRIDVKGHPLAELSRTITAPKLVFECNGRKAYSFEDTLAENCFPAKIRFTPKPSGQVRDKLRILHLENPCSDLSHVYLERIEKKISRLSGAQVPVSIKDFPAVENKQEILASMIELLSKPEKDASLHVLGCPLNSFILSNRSLTESLLKELVEDLQEASVRVNGKDINVLFGKDSRGEAVFAGIKSGDTVAMGPLFNILYLMVDRLVSSIKEGKTPSMPLWLHPVTVAVVWASEDSLDYGRSVAKTLVNRGVNVILIGGGSLGKWVRAAGKRWIPYVVVVGPREASTGTVTVRRRWRPGEQETKMVSEFVEEVVGSLAFHGVLGRLFGPDFLS